MKCPFRGVEKWSVQGVPLGMYAPAFLSLNKKQAKSHDILKAKRLGSIERNKLGLQNRLDPEALRLSMVPNINILLLWCRGRVKQTIFDIQKLRKSEKFSVVDLKRYSSNVL